MDSVIAPEDLQGMDVVETIGRGAQSVVLKATRRGSTFAIKVAHVDRSGFPERTKDLFLREAISLARVRSEGLVQIFDIGESGGRPFIVMEYVDGRPLDQQLRLATHPLSAPEVISLGRSIAMILADVHRYGLVHRDLKPQNILITRDGRVKLLDFGLVASSSGDEAGGFAGTLGYSAPEQLGIVKRPLDGRADLYSLGVILYQCATGQAPFQGETTTELLQRYATHVPANPATLNREIPGPLAEVILKLIAKDPDDRYPSAPHVLDALASLEETHAGAERRSAPRGDDSTALIGRARELGQLQAELATSATQGRFALLLGEPGHGKTRLMNEFLASVREAGTRILAGRCREDDPLPFSAIRSVFAGLLRQLEAAPLETQDGMRRWMIGAAGELGPLIAVAIPKLKPLFAETAEWNDLVSQEQLSAATGRFLENLARSAGALVLTLDDVQWMDDASRKVLGQLTGSLAGVPLLVVGTARSDSASRAAVQRFRAEIGDGLTLTVRVEPFSQEEVAGLTRAFLGELEVDEDLVVRVHHFSHGSPFAAMLFLRSLLESLALRPHWGRWVLDQERLERLNLGSDVLGLVIRRIDQASDSGRRLLGRASLVGGRFPLSLVEEISELAPDALHLALREALRLHLIEQVGTSEYQFVHDQIREAFARSVGAEERGDVHARIAQALEKQLAAGDEDQIFALAHHHFAAGPQRNPRRVFETSLAAGKAALQNYADAEGLVFLTRAQELNTRHRLDQPNVEFYQLLGEANLRLINLVEAERCFREAIRLETAPRRRAMLRAKLTEVLITFGHPHPGRSWDELQQAFVELGGRWPRSGLVQILTLFWYLALGVFREVLFRLRPRRSGNGNERALELTNLYHHGSRCAYADGLSTLFPQTSIRVWATQSKGGTPRDLVLGYTTMTVLLSIALRNQSICDYFTRRARLIAQQNNSPFLLARADLYDSFAHHFCGDPRAEGMLRSTLKTYGRWLDPWDFSAVCLDLGYNLLIRGYTQESLAVDHLARSRLSKPHGGSDHPEISPFVTMSGPAHAMMGNAEEALKGLMKIREETTRSNAVSRSAMTAAHWLLFHLEQDELGQAAEATVAEYENLHQIPILVPYHWYHFYLGVCYLRLRQLERAVPASRSEARKRLHKAISTFKLVAHVPIFKVHLHVVKAAARRLEGRWKRALAELARADREASAGDSPWGAYETWLERARVARAMENTAEATRAAEAALALATRHGWSRKAERVLREFQLRPGSSPIPTSSISSGSNALNISKSKATLDAILRLSLIASQFKDPKAQVRQTLDEAIRILGAERAFLFLVERGSGQVHPELGREIVDGSLRDLTALEGHSRTVVSRVLASREAMVLSGTEQGEALGSESIVSLNLRSIICAPLVVKGEVLGVLYLDNRLAKGMFGEQELEVLQSMASHIAIAFEMARAARVEIERQALEKDLAVTSAVQSLLLPKTAQFNDPGLRCAVHYQPATVCGGDWWWYERGPDGKALYLMADVTGHGPGAAMVTAILSSSFRMARDADPQADPGQLLKRVSDSLRGFCGGQYMATATALLVDPARRTLSTWSLGGLPVMVLRPDGKVQLIAAAGTPLGDSRFDAGFRSVALEGGERIFAYSDGLIEMNGQDGMPLGRKRLLQLLLDSNPLAAEDARAKLVSSLLELRGPSAALEDDCTFAFVDFRRAA